MSRSLNSQLLQWEKQIGRTKPKVDCPLMFNKKRMAQTWKATLIFLQQEKTIMLEKNRFLTKRKLYLFQALILLVTIQRRRLAFSLLRAQLQLRILWQTNQWYLQESLSSSLLKQWRVHQRCSQISSSTTINTRLKNTSWMTKKTHQCVIGPQITTSLLEWFKLTLLSTKDRKTPWCKLC